ncbi:hypothetical protein FOXYS1_5596, partial [Fusarium oxysporum]
MVFESKFPKVDPPSTDVFNFIFNTAREKYSKDKVLYRVHNTGETLTLEELENKSLRLASVLVKKYGIKPNNVIAFLANNSINYPIAFFAALAAGATISPIPVQQGLDALAIIPRLEQADAKLIITDSTLASITKPAAEAFNGIPLISLDSSSDGISNIEALLAEETELFNGFR